MKKKKQKIERALGIVRDYFPGVTSVVDGTKPVIIEVTKQDSDEAIALDHSKCAYALACKRQMKADGVLIGTKTGYIIYGKRAVRYRLPESVSREIVSNDRKAGFDIGTYQLRAPGKWEQLGCDQTGRTHNKSDRKMKRFQHITGNIRTRLGKHAAVILLLCALAVSAQAYSTISNGGADAHWLPGNVPFYINLGQYDAQANAALADWTQYTGATKLRGIDSASGGDWGDGRNEIRWGASMMPGNVLAWTYAGYNWQTGEFSETDIEFNPNFLWGSFEGSGRGYDVNRVLLHELGHAIGLGHSQYGSIMNPYYQYNVWTLSSDDIAGARYLYGKQSVPEGGTTVGLMALALCGVVCMRRYA